MTEPESTNEELSLQILNETDANKLKDLTDTFNLHISKKNLIRAIKYDELLDKISEQMVDRVNKRPDEFSNKDLLDWVQVLQNSVDKSEKHAEEINDIQNYHITQNNQVNVNINETLNKESRQKIASIISTILNQNKNSEEIIDESENNT